MKVDFVHVAWLSNDTLYVSSKVVTNDGIEIALKSGISEYLAQELKRQILNEARNKFMIAAKESNLLPQAVVVEADDIPF